MFQHAADMSCRPNGKKFRGYNNSLLGLLAWLVMVSTWQSHHWYSSLHFYDPHAGNYR